MNRIRTLLIEDEERSMRLLSSMLKELAPDIEVAGTACDVEEAVTAINALRPELIFLDIELAGQLAFSILDRVTWRNFQLIFITAYEAYALKAIRYSAADYLLKPLAREELQQAIRKVRENRALHPESERMDVLKEHLETVHRRITLPTLEGFVVEELDNIRSIEADGNYTRFYLVNGSLILVSRNIQEYETLLEPSAFFRIHRSFIVNLNHVKKYLKGRGGNVVLSNAQMLPVSVRKKEAFIQRLKQM